MHECIIGVRYDYENTKPVTLDELKEYIQRYENIGWKTYELTDYCDKRKSTNLSRFEYCPICGKKIDWKAIKNSQ